VKVITKYGESTLTQVYSLYAGEAQVRVEASVNWQEKRKALKLMFPVNTENGQAATEIPFGHVKKNIDGKEETMQQWADLSGDGIGLTVLNNSKYSVDFHENTIGFTVLRSPVYAHHDPYELREDEEYSYIDQGIQRFTYALLPHDGCWRKAGVMKKAALLNQPLITAFETFHKGSLPLKKSFLKVEKENVQMTALKHAYKGEGFVLRLFENFGAETETEISVGEIKFTAKFSPYEIKTFKITDCGKVQEVDFLEWDI
jgi:alpha-mannosidase